MTWGTQQVSHSRREFLHFAAQLGAATAVFGTSPLRVAAGHAPPKKIVIVTFGGGGARDDETFSLSGQENIPHLLTELATQSTFFTHVVNRGILGHYVATASLAIGVYETINNFASIPPEHPTVFEYFHKQLKRPRRTHGSSRQATASTGSARAAIARSATEWAQVSSCQSIYSPPPCRPTTPITITCCGTATRVRTTHRRSAATKCSCSSSSACSSSRSASSRPTRARCRARTSSLFTSRGP